MNMLEQLQKLTHQLLYIGESEFPFEVVGKGKMNDADIVSTIQKENNASATIVNPHAFFENYIYRLHASGDEVMMKDIARYQALQDFINKNFVKCQVYRCGITKIAVYIVCVTVTGEVFVLKTYSVET